MRLNFSFFITRILQGVCILCLPGCLSQMVAADLEPSFKRNIALDELRIELGDLRHAFESQKVEMQLLRERVAEMESVSNSFAKHRKEGDGDRGRLIALETKMAHLEMQEGRIMNDLRELIAHYERADKAMKDTRMDIGFLKTKWGECNRRLEDIQALKGTLDQVSKAISRSNAGKEESLLYKVKGGDNLEKIAREHRTTVEKIRSENHLKGDRIFLGQELSISPDE